jgi:hypothetical protein
MISGLAACLASLWGLEMVIRLLRVPNRRRSIIHIWSGSCARNTVGTIDGFLVTFTKDIIVQAFIVLMYWLTVYILILSESLLFRNSAFIIVKLSLVVVHSEALVVGPATQPALPRGRT